MGAEAGGQAAADRGVNERQELGNGEQRVTSDFFFFLLENNRQNDTTAMT